YIPCVSLLLSPLLYSTLFPYTTLFRSLEDFETSNFQVLKEIDHYRRLFNLQPEMIVSYDRHAFHGIYDDELRVTCDLNLRCRNDDLALEHGAYGLNFIDTDLVVLEVKVNDSVPL